MAGSFTPTGIKFCGMTRPADAAYAARFGASYVGVIFADSPRQVNEDTARSVFKAAGDSVGHVAVFSWESAPVIAATARRSGADVAQIHGDPTAADIREIRDEFPGEIWAVVSVAPDAMELPTSVLELADAADALLIDARVRGRSGGTGRQLDWAGLAGSVGTMAKRTRIILAGGLTPENVARAINVVGPSIVDVSSGVEISPGVKDPLRMKSFAEAVRSASTVGRTNTRPSGENDNST